MSELINNITANQDKPGLQSKYSKNKVQLRVAALELAARANTRVPEERKVSSRAVLLTVERSLAASASLKPRTREFLALKHVTSFLALAIDGSISENSTRNRDLLPVGHPLSTRAHRMSEAALNSATARWFAADPRIDDSVCELVASAYESPLGSIEYRHSLARINALTAGLVPQDVLISIQPSALVAAGGNSTAARSARANMQRRDRKGQFAFQGGGFQFFLRGLDGKVSSVSGSFVANSDTTDGFHVEVKGDKILQDGLYDVPASKAEAIKAVLPDAPQQDEVSLPSGVEAVDLAEVKPLDAPAGWELVSTKKPGEAGPDKVFKSGDGYIVEYYEPGNKSTKDAASSAWKSNTAPGSSLTDPPNLINSKGETGMKGKLQSDQPVYILKRDPDAGNTKSNKKAVAITQSWYDTQNEAGKDEKAFDNDIQAKIDQEGSVAKDQKASLEKAQADKADKDKANKPIQDANAQTASEVQANLDSGKDAYGNPLPEGWTVSKNELNPMQTDSQGNAVPIDKSKAATYSRTEQNIPMSVSHKDDGSLNFNGESAKSWDDVEAATPDYVKGKIDENRSAVKESVKKFDTDGKVADIIDNGGGADEINAELQKNEVWKAAQEDLSTSAFVDAPSKVQKDKWAELEKNNKDIRDILPPYEDTSKPEPKAILPESSSEKISAGSKSQSAPSTPPTPGTPEFVTPDGAYKLQSPEDFEPQGRDGEDSTNYTDDPEVLSNRFSEQELSNALMQATIGVNDPTKDLIAELEDINTDAPEDDGADTKKKPGPKKKKEKPQQTNNASGSGSLEFNAGEEWVPAEAIYNALKNQGVDADMLLAKIYDSALGDSTNVSALTKSNKEDTINAQSPTPALDAFEGTEEDTMQKLNVELAGVDKASIAVVQTDDFRKKNNGEPNPKIVDLATQIRGIQKDGKGHYKILEDNIELAFSDDPQDREAFQSLWGLMTALDYGYTSNLAGVEGLDSDLLDNTELMQAVSSAIESYNGSSPTGEELDAFITENGTYLDFLNSKANIVNGDEEVGGDSLASGYYRLLAENSRYNDTTLYRGIQVPRNSEDLAQLIGKGNVVAFDGRPFTNDGTTASSFAGVMYAGDNGNDGVIFSIAPMKGKAADVQQVSPFADENELPVLGNYKITKVTSVKQPTGRTIHKVEVEKLDKRSSVLEGYDSDYEPLLIVDNSSPTMPEGYYEIGAAAYTPTAPEDRDPGLPEDFDDSPVTIARQWEKADLADAFRSAIEDGSGKTILVYPDGYEATIDVEAVRDALQIQGVDTNSLLDDIASAAPDAGASTEESKPVESSVGSPLDSIIKDVSQIYEINGWKKVGPQLGSNEGGMTKSPEGDQYYVKTPKSELHAQNETLAAALYRLAGVDAAEVYMGKDENGKLKTFTPDINGKQDLANNLNNPEYLAKLQDGFAVDAWLGNWDVAGLAYDNVMTNENGDPVRVDPGGALLFRAMGAPKGSLFGSEVNELDSLRDPNMNQQSYTVFGSMTDEQQKESARKLLSVSNDDINNMVDSIITDDKSATELKDKLAARRQYILDRYDLSSEDSSLLVDNAGTPDDSVKEDLGVQSPEAHTKEVDSRMSIASGWADEYSTDKKLVNLSVDRKNFATIAEQIDVALKDWRNGEISDEELPGVLNELDDFIDSFTYNDDSSASAADDLQDQLRSLQTYIKDHNKQNGVEEPTPEEPAPSVDTPVDDIPNNPYKDSQGTPIVEGQKLKYKKNDVEEVGTFNRYDKNQTYVWVKFDDGKKAKAISTKYLTVVDEGGGDEGPKAPEAPPSKEDLSPGAENAPTPTPPPGAMTAADSKGNLIWSGMEITDKDGNTGTVIKVNKDNYAFVKFPDGTTKWRSSKSVVGSGNVSAGASNLPIGSKGSTKVTGAGVVPVKVENPSDWSSSDFEAVPSLDSAIKKTMDTSDKSNAARGASAAVDSDSIEDLDVRFTHEVNAEGSEVLKAKFKLTNWAAKARVKKILAMNDKELAANGITITENVRVPATTLNAEGLITSSSNDNYLYTSSLGRTYTIKTSDKVTIKIFRANKDDTTKFINTFSNGAPKALHNLVTIEAPVDATPEMIASAIQNAGVSEVRPATEADARILKENRLMSVFDAKTDANINLKGTQREESLQRIKDRYDITVDDVEVSIGNSGRIETRLSEEGAAKVVEATGSPNALRHTLTFRGYATYEKAKTLFDLLTNPQGGLLSTTARWSEGTPAVGQSSAHDISTGGADYVFTRPISNALSEATYGAGGSGVSIHLNPLKMYQRLDFYANQGDKYGKRFKANDVISSARVGAYEVMFKGRVGFDLADRIIVSQDVYNELMPLFAAKGITEIAGVPIDQLIVKPTG